MTSTLLTLAILFPAAPAPAPKDTGPKGLPPRVVTVSAVSDNSLQFLQVTHVLTSQKVQVPEQVQTEQGVVQVTKAKTIEVPVPVQRITRVSLDDKGVQVYGADGKKIDPKEVRKRVAKPVAALLSADGKPVDPFYLRLAREGTLVFVIPAAPLRQDFSDPDRPKDAAPKPLEVKPVPVRKR
ncbi:MAG TPA: hypothetical protein VH575_14485 [Gemmataceae bacterium]